jgi:hypothetical protein
MAGERAVTGRGWRGAPARRHHLKTTPVEQRTDCRAAAPRDRHLGAHGRHDHDRQAGRGRACISAWRAARRECEVTLRLESVAVEDMFDLFWRIKAESGYQLKLLDQCETPPWATLALISSIGCVCAALWLGDGTLRPSSSAQIPWAKSTPIG